MTQIQHVLSAQVVFSPYSQHIYNEITPRKEVSTDTLDLIAEDSSNLLGMNIFNLRHSGMVKAFRKDYLNRNV